MDIDSLQPIHPVIFLVSFVCLVFTIIWMIVNRKRWLIGITPLFFFLHLFIYNISLHFSLLPPETLELWSGAIRLQALLSFMIMLIFYPRRRK